MKKLYFMISLLVFGLSVQLNAQTLDVDYSGDCGGNYTGLDASQVDAQSFTAGLTGNLSKVSFNVSIDDFSNFNPVNANNQPINSMSFTAQIYDGDGCSGTLLTTQTFSIPFNTAKSFYDITFNTPAQVIAGQKYTIQITPTAGEKYNMMGQNNIFARWYTGSCSGVPTYSGGTPYVRCSPDIYSFQFKTYVSNGTLGTVGSNANKSISLYPNPVINSLNLSGLTKKENYTINDLSGKQISSGIIEPKQEINISNLLPGNYILKLANKTLKFIKK